MISLEASPEYFKSCGLEPNEANGNTSVFSPIEVCPSTTTWECKTEPPAIETFFPTTENGPIVTSGAMLAPSSTTAEGCIPLEDVFGSDIIYLRSLLKNLPLQQQPLLRILFRQT